MRVYLEHQNQVEGDGARQSVPPFDLERILPRYRHSHKRLILVDFEGTLWLRDPLSRTFDPPEDGLEALKALSEDERNDVWLLSGLQIGGALDRIARRLPNVGLV